MTTLLRTANKTLCKEEKFVTFKQKSVSILFSSKIQRSGLYIYIYIYIYMYIYVNLCIFMCVYIYTHIHIYVFWACCA